MAGQSYLHNPGSEPLVDDTLGDILYQAANKHPDRIAVTSLHEDVSMTYGELLRQVSALQKERVKCEEFYSSNWL